MSKNNFRKISLSVKLSLRFFPLVLFLLPSISNAITSTSLSTAYKSYVTRAIILPTPPPTTDILSTLRALLSQKEYIDLLRGPQGPQGPAGITTTIGSMYSGQPVASIQPSSPAPIPAVFAPVGISQPDPNHNFSGGSYFSATNLSSSELSTTNLHVSGNTTIVGSLNVTGPINGSLSTSNNLTGPITSIGNATSVASQTGTGSTFVMQTSPTLITPNLGVATATSITGTGGTSTATARVAGLNADYLDGFDSNAFGSATVENQTIIINAIGTNADANVAPGSASSLFSALKWLDDKTTNPMGLPFNGILGDARHGNLTISSPTTATETIYQLNNLTVSSTWTAKQQNPGGFMVAVKGTCTFQNGGIIDANGTGGLGGSSQTGAGDNVGRNGMYGHGFAGGAGSGGGDGTKVGGYGAGTLDVPIGKHMTGTAPYDFSPSPYGAFGYNGMNASNPFGAFDNNYGPTAMNGAEIMNWAGAHINAGSAAVSTSTGGVGYSPNSEITAFFDAALVSDIWQAIGFGGGGGSGALNAGSGTSGAGGKGGGFIVLVCNTLNFQSGAIIRAAGSAGANATTNGGGGGGGGGGTVIVLYRTLVANAGTISVSGGAAGAAGGAAGTAPGGAGAAGYSKVADIRR